MRNILVTIFIASGIWCYFLLLPFINVDGLPLAILLVYVPFNLGLVVSFYKSLSFYDKALEQGRLNLSATNTINSCEQEYRWQAAFALVLLSFFYFMCIFFCYEAK